MPRAKGAVLAFLAGFLLLHLAACQPLVGSSSPGAVVPTNQVEEPKCEDVSKLGPSEDRCAFVREHCPAESLLNYPQLYYCHVAPHGTLVITLMLVLCTGLLVLLFRIIGRAADDFFSCILSQISQDLGLPPRLGGVTLLALGNGAPDLSSSIAAVKTGNYRLAMGALTGAGMFVGCVVAGRIVTLSGGARARGAQIRDICTQFIAVAVVTGIVVSGYFTYGGVAALLSIYGAYVVVVAVADFSKRMGVEWAELARGVQRRMSRRWGVEMEGPLLSEDYGADGGAPLEPQQSQLGEPLTDVSRASPQRGQQQQQQQQQGLLRLAPAGSLPVGVGAAAWPSGSRAGSPPLEPAGDGGPRVTSLPDFQASRQQQQWQQRLPRRGPPVASFQPHHVAYEELLHMPAKEYRQRALAEMAQSKSFYRRDPRDDESAGDEDEGASSSDDDLDLQYHRYQPWRQDEEWRVGRNAHTAAAHVIASTYQPPVVSFDATILERRAAAEAAAAEEGQHHMAEPAAAAAIEHEQQHQQPQRQFEHQGSGASRRSAESGASTTQFSIASMELAGAPAAATAAAEEADAERQGPLQRALDAVQTPLMVLLQATIPLVEVNSYQRPWFLRSLAASPLFIVAFVGLFSWQALLVAVAAGFALAAGGYLGTQRLEGKAPLWTLGTGYPIGAALVAVYGFAVAAMWISLFASEIVGLIQFFGILSKVDPAILGVTVLAWGNSLMDFINNTAMAARSRGGNSMAMTACFAGPLFNMLVGLGLGFWALLEESHATRAAVVMDPVVLTGCLFTMLNCSALVAVSLLHRQWLPAWCGWAMVGTYAAYLAVALVVVVLT